MVESQPSKLLVAGSIPVSRSRTSLAGRLKPVHRGTKMKKESEHEHPLEPS